jgi:TIR domain
MPSVFISYSHDSPEHKAWALKLATDLRNSGIDATIDQWDLVPGQDVATFMQRGITTTDRVLMLCSETYVAKADGGHGGVGYERLIVTAEVVEAIETKKFIPLVRNNPSKTKTPKFLGPRLYIDFSAEEAYATNLEALCREILGEPANKKPPLGANPFSGEIPKTAEPARIVGLTGAGSTGESVLSGPWFEAQRQIAEKGAATLKIAGLMELRFALHDPINKSQLDLLNAVKASEIDTFGWPIGVVLGNRDEYRPRPFGDGIRTEVSIAREEMTGRQSYDYWALAKNGDFYLLQNLFEDMREEGKVFFNTRIVRVTESLMFASAMYAKLGAPPETKLSIRVGHRGLAGRMLSSAGGRRYISSRKCLEQNSESEIVTTIGSVHETLVADVQRLLEPMFMLFEFAQFNESVYTDIVRRFEKGESS